MDSLQTLDRLSTPSTEGRRTFVASVDSLQTLDLLPAPSTEIRRTAIRAPWGTRTGGLVTVQTEFFTAADSKKLDTIAPQDKELIETRAED